MQGTAKHDNIHLQGKLSASADPLWDASEALTTYRCQALWGDSRQRDGASVSEGSIGPALHCRMHPVRGLVRAQCQSIHLSGNCCTASCTAIEAL